MKKAIVSVGFFAMAFSLYTFATTQGQAVDALTELFRTHPRAVATMLVNAANTDDAYAKVVDVLLAKAGGARVAESRAALTESDKAIILQADSKAVFKPDSIFDAVVLEATAPVKVPVEIIEVVK